MKNFMRCFRTNNPTKLAIMQDTGKKPTIWDVNRTDGEGDVIAIGVRIIDDVVCVREGDVDTLIIDNLDCLCAVSAYLGWDKDSKKDVTLLDFARAIEAVTMR